MTFNPLTALEITRHSFILNCLLLHYLPANVMLKFVLLAVKFPITSFVSAASNTRLMVLPDGIPL